MIKAPLPPNEAERLAALHRLLILDTPPEERFDRITRLTKRFFNVDIVAVSLVDTDRQWFKSCLGLPVRETPRDISFCGHAILCKDVMVVPDARLDPRFSDNPLVTGEPWIRFYAGCPLAGPDGNRLGTLCIIDTRPREMTDPDRHALRDYAALVENEMTTVRILEHAVARLKESEDRIQTTLDNVIDGVLAMTARGQIRSINAAGQTLFGYEPEEIIDKNITSLLHDDSHGVLETILEHSRTSSDTEDSRREPREVSGQRKDGRTFPMELALRKTTWNSQPLFIVTARNISERKAHAALLEYQATHDVLTDLPNRILLYDRLQQAILRGRRENEPVALLVMDISRFKEINLALGHDHGDILLQQFGLRLRGLLRASDSVARLGGDEFAVLLPKANSEGAMVATGKIQKALEVPFVLDDLSLDIAVTIGIAVYPDHGEDASTLLQRADVAMVEAKKTDGGFFVYATEHDPHTPRRLALMGELRHAIEENQLFLLYQPKINLRTARVEGVEALVRWQHPRLGLIPPDQFILLAEQTGQIKPLTQWVLEEALRQTQLWHQAGVKLSIAVNLSARNLQDPRLPDQVAEHLKRWGVPPQYLELEITEGTIMLDPARAMTILKQLNKMGVAISIDDFGTGYSSLGYLKRLPVHAIKIDKSFVIGMAVDEHDAVIVRSTIDLGHNLGLKVIAEGIENREIFDKMTALGCDAAQGYYMSRPVPPKELERWLSESPWGLKNSIKGAHIPK